MTGSHRNAARRVSLALLAVTAVTTVLAGCVPHGSDPRATRGTEPSVDADTAKQQMIDAVDDATGRLGGSWKARTGPDYTEDCALPDGGQGAPWRYLTGSTLEGTPEEDAARMADHWRSQGMSIVERDSSDGPAIFGGGGGKIASISVYAYSGNYTVQAVSLCFPGDADQISESQAAESDDS
jgi:hypothetical protein